MVDNPASLLTILIIMIVSGISAVCKYGKPSKKEVYLKGSQVGFCLSRKY